VWHEPLSDEKFSAIRFEVDEGLSSGERERGCSRCSGRLHRADYPRKVRGLTYAVTALFDRRFSFCRARCRKRQTPPSARFLGRRVYTAVAVLIGALIALAITLAEAARATGARVRTVAHWLEFFQGELLGAASGIRHRGRSPRRLLRSACGLRSSNASRSTPLVIEVHDSDHGLWLGLRRPFRALPRAA